jgi:hypothetical protein
MMDQKKKNRVGLPTLLLLLAFVIGALSIYFQILDTVVPLVLVFLYGGLLFFFSRKKRFKLSNTDKNAPYYLGLLFTLSSLFFLSIKTGFSFEFGPLLTSLGIALSTTILGLVFRQVLLNLDTPPSEDYTTLLRQVRNQTVELQERFLSLRDQMLHTLDGYEKLKTTILERESKMTAASVESLRQQTFATLEKEFPEKIKKVLDSVSDYYIEDHEITIGQMLPDGYDSEISERFSVFFKEFMDSLRADTEDFLSSLSRASLKLRAELLDESSTERVSSIKKSVRYYESEMKDLLAALEKKRALLDS